MKRKDNKSLPTTKIYVKRKSRSRPRWQSSRDLSKRLERKVIVKLKLKKQLPSKQMLKPKEKTKLLEGEKTSKSLSRFLNL